MANFDHQSLEYLKKLCRIECSAEENEDIRNSLSRVLEYVEQLNEVNTENTRTCRYVLRGMQENQMREDEVKNPISREEFLANAPEQIGGMIKVPSVLNVEN